MRLQFTKIPSEPRGYTVWVSWGDFANPHANGGAGSFLVGTVRPLGAAWTATVDDGRKPNVLNGTTRHFDTRQAAAEWLKDTIAAEA